jgi:hypothetical protein
MPMAVTSRPVGTGITSQAVIEVAKTKDEREDAERRMEMQVTSTPRQIVPSAQLSTDAPEQQYPMPMSVTSRPVTTGLVSQTAITQQNNYTTSTQSNSMGISFLGNTSDFKTWFFSIDGKTFVASNSSTVSPLLMRFTNGKFSNFSAEKINANSPLGPLVKNHSFDIITGTSETANSSTGVVMTGIVEWTWAGQKYRSRWTLTEGEILYRGLAEEGEKDTYYYDLRFATPYTPYDGPTGGTVGGGVVSQKTVEAQQSGGTAPSGGGTAPSGGGTAPSGGGTVPSGGGGLIRTPFTTTTTATGGGTPVAVPGVEVVGTDWVKLGLQIGAAYLLFS